MLNALLTLLALGFFVLVAVLAVRDDHRYELCVTHGNHWVSGNCIDGGKDGN